MLNLIRTITISIVALATSANAEPAPHIATFVGMCDASAAAALDAERLIVADDEDNILRVYARTGGKALFEYDVSEFLGVQGKKKPKEADLEAAAQLGDLTFWITSHGRNSKGKDKPERQRLFATRATVSGDKIDIAPVGQPYSELLDVLLADERLAKLGLELGATLAPKAPGGLNIEGLAGSPEGHLLIGFRSPVPGGKAIVVTILNPREVIDGAAARLGEPRLLDLQGLGIRSIEFCAGRYLIIAGSTGEQASVPQLFEWDGKGQPKPVATVTLKGLNPEGISFQGDGEKGVYFLLSDDGTQQVDGKDCKKLKDPEPEELSREDSEFLAARAQARASKPSTFAVRLPRPQSYSSGTPDMTERRKPGKL